MPQIQSYVFFDLETTGLPHQERNRTKITELSFIAVSRYDIEITNYGGMPPTHKLSLLFNPEKEISPMSVKLTGLSGPYLKNCPPFRAKIKSILSFIQELPKPVCLIAHNGNTFDFKILLSEFFYVSEKIPDDILCVDSLIGFKKLLKNTDINYMNLSTDSDSEILTDDEEDWPALNVSKEEWSIVDQLSASLSDVSFEDKTNERKENKTVCVSTNTQKTEKTSYTLSSLYRRLLNKEEPNAHRAEVDCLMLIECVVAIKHLFMPWADVACKNISDIKPFIPY